MYLITKRLILHEIKFCSHSISSKSYVFRNCKTLTNSDAVIVTPFNVKCRQSMVKHNYKLSS